jgi:hypothetical protein
MAATEELEKKSPIRILEAHAGWLDRPLCRRYAYAGFKTFRIPVGQSDAVSDVSWHWAFGLFAEEYEVLGAWPAQTEPALVAQALVDRGIEHIAATSADSSSELIRQSWNSTTRLIAEALSDRPARGTAHNQCPQQRIALLTAAAAADVVQATVERAIKRRGPFPDETAAADFVTAALQKADQRFYGA